MSDTTFIDGTTVIPATWAQDVNNTVYRALGSAGVAPTTPATVRTNLGVPADSAVVHNTGNETIAGNKTFSGTTVFSVQPTVPDASTAQQAAAFHQIGDAITAATGRLINVRVFTIANTGSTYTPTTGTTFVIVEAVGGGGGAGGSVATAAGQYSLGCSGGGGSYAKAKFTSSFNGVTLTIGDGGTAGTAAGNGIVGGTTSFGSLLSCPGGLGGIYNGAVSSGGNWHQAGAAGGGTPTGAALLALPGETAEPVWTAGSLGFRGRSGASPLGTSIASNPSTGNGVDATVAANGYGVGGLGAFSAPSEGARVGGAGSPGVIIVWEYA